MSAQFPYRILALAPFAAAPAGARIPAPTPVHRESVDECVASVGARFWVGAPTEACPSAGFTVSPRRMRDFRPDALAKAVPEISRLLDAAGFVGEALAAGVQEGEIAGGVASRIPGVKVDLSASATAQRGGGGAVDDLLAMVAMPSGAPASSASPSSGPLRWKSDLESMAARLVECVFSDPSFRACEASWRGVELLVRQGPVTEDALVQLEFAPVSAESLATSLEALGETLAQDPPDLVLIDVPFDSSPVMADGLASVAALADRLLCPTAFCLGAGFFGIGGWRELRKIPYISHFLEGAQYAKWRAFTKTPEAAWACGVAGRLVGRLGHGAEAGAPFGLGEEGPLWLGGVWALGTLAAQSVVRHGWPTRFTDYNSFKIKDLQVFSQGGSASSVEAVLSEDRVHEMAEAGLTPLTGGIGRDDAFIPKSSALSGEPLAGRMFVARVSKFLIQCRESAPEGLSPDDGAEFLRSSLAALFEESGQEAPRDLAVSPAEGGGGSTLMRVSFTPPRNISPILHPLELSVGW